VQVHHNEGVAIHIGPESCAGGREAVREALTHVPPEMRKKRRCGM
jgi:hypothetical protein